MGKTTLDKNVAMLSAEDKVVMELPTSEVVTGTVYDLRHTQM